MTNSTVTRKISAAFLATVLVAGIIALSTPSFMVGAQAVPGYGMDSYDKKSYGNDDKKSYGSDPGYGMDSYDKKSYGNDDKKSYGSDPEYGMDSYDKKSYGNDDYKSQYSTYGKDRDSDKSKDSVSIKKVKCNNINLNLNGITIGAGGNTTNGGSDGSDDASIGAASLSGNGDSTGYGNGERNHKFVDKKDGFVFVCINNNNNVAGGGNATDGNATDACEDCFAQTLNATEFAAVEAALAAGIDIEVVDTIVVPIPTEEISSFAELCALIEANPMQLTTILQQVLDAAGLETLDTPTFMAIVDCISLALDIDIRR